MSAVLRQPERRDGFERRDERTEQWLVEVDRRHGSRRFAEVEAERVADLECGPRNEHVHPVFASLFEGFGL